MQNKTRVMTQASERKVCEHGKIININWVGYTKLLCLMLHMHFSPGLESVHKR